MTPEQIAERQFGLVTTAQLRGAGISNRTASYWTKTGKLVREAKGLYRLPGVPQSREGLLLRAQLATGGVLTHRSAAFIWNINGIRPVRPEVIVAIGTTTPRTDVIAYRRRLIEDDITNKGPFVLTKPSRTLLDLASVLDERRLEVAVDDAVTRAITSLADLAARVEGSKRGVAGVVALRAIVEDRIANGTPASHLETTALRRLKKDGLPRPISQFVVNDAAGTFVARPDLVYPDARLAIELDGDRYHATKEQRRNDRGRQNRLVLAGYIPLRFDEQDVRTGEMTRSLFAYLRTS